MPGGWDVACPHCRRDSAAGQGAGKACFVEYPCHCPRRNVMQNLPLVEKKLLYRVLHQSLSDFPELMDSEFLHDLQRDLQKIAQAEGVDVAHHGDWDAWLGN